MSDSAHPLYDKYKKQWSRIRDVLEGSDEVKEKKEAYLPRLSGQSDTDYASYILRATFFNIAARVYDSNVGMITRRTPKVDLPKSMSVYMEDKVGFTSFTELSSSVIKEMLAIGSMGVLIDIKADIPVPVIYSAENIKNWSLTEEGDLASLVLEEIQYDENDTEQLVTYKYGLNVAGVCIVEKFIDGVSQGTLTPSLKGMTLDYIPFVGGNFKGINMQPLKSPILDIVDMNLSHYRTSADYEHGLHFVALPTPVFSGVTMDTPITLGGTKGIVLPSDGAKAYYLEFQGQGLDALNKALATKQSQISVFSARLQDTTTKGSEAENTVKLRYSADSASLFGIAQSAELVLNEVYKIIAIWLKEDPDQVTISLNKDFMSTRLTSAELKELAKAYVDGALDEETYIYNLERGEMSIPGVKPRLPPRVENNNNGNNDNNNNDVNEDVKPNAAE